MAARKPYGLPEPSAERPESSDAIACAALDGTVVGRKAAGPGTSDCSEGDAVMLTPLATMEAFETLRQALAIGPMIDGQTSPQDMATELTEEQSRTR